MGTRKALGKGLNALFPEIHAIDYGEQEQKGDVILCPVDAISPNPRQPRRSFDDERIDELAASLKSTGIIQPLIVRKNVRGNYELIAGERRWRAAIKAGLSEVPVLVREVPDDKALMISLIENIQREDLNPIEEASAYQRLIGEFDLTQESVAEIVGKDRSTVTNMLRLLKLPESIKEDLAAGRISSGHARALLGLEDGVNVLKLHNKILSKQLSVRETERLLKRMKGQAPVSPPKKKDIHLLSLQQKLQYLLGTQVKIIRKGKKGRIEISFFSDDELERIIGIVQGGSRSYGAKAK